MSSPSSPRVTLQPVNTPSQDAVQKAQEVFEVEDARGRRIGLKKPNVLAQYRLVEALGESAANQQYLMMVLPFIYVASIDGDRVLLPGTKGEVEALIQQLDEDGIQAVIEGVQAHFSRPSPEADRDLLKK